MTVCGTGRVGGLGLRQAAPHTPQLQLPAHHLNGSPHTPVLIHLKRGQAVYWHPKSDTWGQKGGLQGSRQG